MEPFVTSRRELLAAGYAPSEVRRRLRDGQMVPVRRGAYLVGHAPPEPERRHVIAVRAAVREVAVDAVVSHVSAAALLGLPLWRAPIDHVHVTRCRRSGARRGPGVHVHAAPLDPDEIVTVGGVRVTSPARTVVDLARSLPFEQAVVVADAALYAKLLTESELAVALARAGGRPGVPAARRVVAFADGRSESVGETRSRIAISRAGLPTPVLQWPVQLRPGWPERRPTRVDFGWPERQTVAEFDGKVKYGRLLRPGQEPGEVVFEEKLREDALRALGLRVVRWTWPDIATFAATAARLREALAQS